MAKCRRVPLLEWLLASPESGVFQVITLPGRQDRERERMIIITIHAPFYDISGPMHDGLIQFLIPSSHATRSIYFLTWVFYQCCCCCCNTWIFPGQMCAAFYLKTIIFTTVMVFCVMSWPWYFFLSLILSKCLRCNVLVPLCTIDKSSLRCANTPCTHNYE